MDILMVKVSMKKAEKVVKRLLMDIPMIKVSMMMLIMLLKPLHMIKRMAILSMLHTERCFLKGNFNINHDIVSKLLVVTKAMMPLIWM